MPNRIIREGINSSPRVNQLSMGADNLYRRLMCVADDYGRYYASPVTVRGGCWPTHPSPPCEQDVSNWIAECVQGVRPLLTIYEVDGCRYLQITDFNQKARSKSKFPDPASGLRISCEQVADELSALGVIRLSSVVCRNSSVVVGEVQNGIVESEPLIPMLPMQSEFPLIIAEIRKHDPAVDESFVRALANKTFQYCQSHPHFPPAMLEHINDKNIARCCAESYKTGPRIHTTGLLLSRVPPIAVTWSLED